MGFSDFAHLSTIHGVRFVGRPQTFDHICADFDSMPMIRHGIQTKAFSALLRVR